MAEFVVAFQKVSKSGSVCLQALFFFDITLAILGLLHLHIDFRISLSIHTHTHTPDPAGILTGIMLTL